MLKVGTTGVYFLSNSTINIELVILIVYEIS